MAEYTYTKYCRDKALVAANPENLGTLDKIELLKQYGYRNLRGGVPGIQARQLPLITIESFLEDPAAIASALMKRNPGVSATDDKVADVEHKLISRVNKAFNKTYQSASRKVKRYRAKFEPPKPQPKPSPLETRTQQYLFPVPPSEISHLRSDGKRKR